jgi:hypothetical protein
MDLKPYYDAAVAAEAEVKRVALEIDGHFTAGETDKALELRPALDEAKNKAKDANDLYLSMRNAHEGKGVEAQFVPANPDAAPQGSADEKKSMTRLEFLALNASERMSFILAGGTVGAASND